MGLKLRHGDGSNYVSRDFLEEIAFLGLESSPTFVREPEGHGVAEHFIRNLKKILLWVRTFEELRLALIEIAQWYNTQWLIARHGQMTPAQGWAEQQQPGAFAA